MCNCRSFFMGLFLFLFKLCGGNFQCGNNENYVWFLFLSGSLLVFKIPNCNLLAFNYPTKIVWVNYLWLSCLTVTLLFNPEVFPCKCRFLFLFCSNNFLPRVVNCLWTLVGNEIQVPLNVMKNLPKSYWYFWVKWFISNHWIKYLPRCTTEKSEHMQLRSWSNLNSIKIMSCSNWFCIVKCV